MQTAGGSNAHCALAPMVLSLVLLSLPEPIVSLHARQNGYEHIGGIQSSHPVVNEQKCCGACLLLQGNSKKALHLLVPLLVLYQLSGFGWLMSDIKSVLSDETVFLGCCWRCSSILSLKLIPKFKPEQYWSILRLRSLLCCYWLRQLSAATVLLRGSGPAELSLQLEFFRLVLLRCSGVSCYVLFVRC
jgi:hypothetical protein